MSGPTFAPSERVAIDGAFAEAEEALASAGLWPGGRDAVHLAHHRAVVRRCRGRRGRKPAHRQIAAAALEWARGAGEPRLYAAMAIAAAVEERFGPDAALRAAALWPPLGDGRQAGPAFADTVRALVRVSPETASARSEA